MVDEFRNAGALGVMQDPQVLIIPEDCTDAESSAFYN